MPTRHTTVNRPKIKRQDAEFAASLTAREHGYTNRGQLPADKSELRALAAGLVAQGGYGYLKAPAAKAPGLYSGKDVGLVGKMGRYRATNTYGNGSRTELRGNGLLRASACSDTKSVLIPAAR